MRKLVGFILTFLATFLAWLLESVPQRTRWVLANQGGWFGTQFRALPGAAVEAAATPSSGHSQESIWDQRYDVQTYVDATTTRLTFFQTTNVDRSITNMQQGGTLPSPWTLQIHMICADYLSTTPVSTAAGGVDGILNDLAFLLLGSAQRSTWTLNINEKDYGPYSLTLLHGTGGPAGFGWGTFTAEESIQFARNDPTPGWNYFGRIIILQQNGFRLTMDWAAAANITADTRVRASLFGVLNRKVQ